MNDGKNRTGTQWATWCDSIERVPKPGDTVYGIGSGRLVACRVTETHNPKGFFVCGVLTLPDGGSARFFDAADMYLYRQWYFNRDNAMAEIRGSI